MYAVTLHTAANASRRHVQDEELVQDEKSYCLHKPHSEQHERQGQHEELVCLHLLVAASLGLCRLWLLQLLSLYYSFKLLGFLVLCELLV